MKHKRYLLALALGMLLSGCGKETVPQVTAAPAETAPTEAAVTASIQAEDRLPGNSTPYDLDYALGAGHMVWELLEGQWYVDFGVQNPSPTSAELVFENSADYKDSRISAAASTGDRFWLEELTEGQWAALPVEDSIEREPISAGTRIALSWETPLEPGFYRVGIDCSVDAGELGTDQKVCYGKFRIFDPETKESLDFCRSSLQNLLNADHWHLTSHDIFRHKSRPDEDHFLHHEIWKHGEDSLILTESRMLADNEFRFVNGQQILEGQGFRLEFEGEDFSGPVSREALEDPTLSDIWTFPYRILDSLVREVRKTDAGITVICDCTAPEPVEKTEFVFSFQSDGSLRALQRVVVGTDGRRSVEAELTVLDGSPEEIAAEIRKF